MISILVSEENNKDADFLIAEVKETIARLWDERAEIFRVQTQEELNECMKQREKLDAAVVDVTAEDGVLVAKDLRRKYPDIEILIVSDVTVSPIVYLNPEVRAASLLLKPLQKKNAESTIKEFLTLLEHEDNEAYFLVDQKGEKGRFPYQKIQYFEARAKKVYIRVSNVEYPIYDTIDHLVEVLPEDFLRCHRSYIVNIIYIEIVKYSENCILLSGDYSIPLSRSYKATVKEVMSRG